MELVITLTRMMTMMELPTARTRSRMTLASIRTTTTMEPETTLIQMMTMMELPTAKTRSRTILTSNQITTTTVLETTLTRMTITTEFRTAKRVSLLLVTTLMTLVSLRTAMDLETNPLKSKKLQMRTLPNRVWELAEYWEFQEVSWL